MFTETISTTYAGRLTIERYVTGGIRVSDYERGDSRLFIGYTRAEAIARFRELYPARRAAAVSAPRRGLGAYPSWR